jgi:probable rRNA maturation factor
VKFTLYNNYDRVLRLRRGRISVPMHSNVNSWDRLNGVSRFPKGGPLWRAGKIVRKIVREAHKKADSISVVLVSDDFLLDINKRFLNHNYKTDVISFDLGDDGTIDGEIYISVDRAKVQAKRYKVPLETEIVRLIFHGTLHLVGLKDRTRSEKLLMRKQENILIEKYYETQNGEN